MNTIRTDSFQLALDLLCIRPPGKFCDEIIIFFTSLITTSVFLYSFIQKTTQSTNEINYQLMVANNRMTEMVNPPIFQQKLNLEIKSGRTETN